MTGAAECFVCRKHREQGPLLPGGPVGEDELVIVSHLTPAAPDRPSGPVYLGHLLVEPRRHAPGLADLTDAEARAVGWWCTQASRALREAAGAEHMYAAVIGDKAAHLHVHLLPRYPGTPREYWWDRVDEWPGARRGTARNRDARRRPARLPHAKRDRVARRPPARGRRSAPGLSTYTDGHGMPHQ